MAKEILFSGIQPSGEIHLGNYLGAIKQWLRLQNEYESYFCIVDLHALTVQPEPKDLTERTLNLAALFLACGLDPRKNIIFIQSRVPAHPELSWILSPLVKVAELERMTQYKDKAEAKGANAGLFTYPILMAADILLYQTNIVPVGVDQKQHLELTKTVAERFNRQFGQTLTVPKEFITKQAAKIMALDDPIKKMSSSAPNQNSYLALTDSPELLAKKISRATTDSGSNIVFNPEDKPGVSNLLNLLHLLTDRPLSELEKQFQGKTYADLKKELTAVVIEFLAPIQKKYQELSRDNKKLLKILSQGAAKAQNKANQTLNMVKEKVGLVS